MKRLRHPIRAIREPFGTAGRVRLTLLLTIAAAFLLVPAAQAFAGTTEKVAIEGSGSGEVSSVGGAEIFYGEPGHYEGNPPIECHYASPGPQTGTCEDEMSFEEAEFGEGTFLAAHAAPGSEFVEWRVESTNGNVIGCEEPEAGYCMVFYSEGNGEETEVVAVFASAAPTITSLNPTSGSTVGGEVVTIHGTELTGVEEVKFGTTAVTCENTVATCKAESATEVKVTTPANAAGEVDVTAKTAAGTSATTAADKFTFNTPILNPTPLTVFKGGNGAGTVTSSPSGIDCLPGEEECSAQFEEGEAVTLTANPAAGSVFVGWLGCHHTGTFTCSVTVNGPETEVTAVFLAEGAPGAPGTNGKNIVATEITTAGLEGHCAGVGGVRVEVEGESSTRKYICNGTNGTNGTNGSNGATGPQGNPGSNGSNGAQGSQGPAGPAGAQGPAGPQGKRGPGGKVKVTCKVKGAKKVVCTVQQPKASKSSALSWSLHRGKRTLSHGRTSARRLQAVLNHLRAGRYSLHVGGQGNTAIRIG
jgi:hypothetical protein